MRKTILALSAAAGIILSPIASQAKQVSFWYFAYETPTIDSQTGAATYDGPIQISRLYKNAAQCNKGLGNFSGMTIANSPLALSVCFEATSDNFGGHPLLQIGQ